HFFPTPRSSSLLWAINIDEYVVHLQTNQCSHQMLDGTHRRTIFRNGSAARGVRYIVCIDRNGWLTFQVNTPKFKPMILRCRLDREGYGAPRVQSYTGYRDFRFNCPLLGVHFFRITA